MGTLQHKIVIVAGAAGGIGTATAILMVQQGATVVLAGRRNPRLAPLLAQLQETNPRCMLFEGDLSRYDSWLTLVQRTERQLGHIDVLVHTVGALNPNGLLEQQPSDISVQIGSNLTSLVYGAKAILPHMLERREGEIVVIGSLGGIVPLPYLSIYSATKYAVRGFCFSLFEELRGTGVRVSLLSSGSIETGMLDLESDYEASILTFISKPLSPYEVAEAVLRSILNPKREVLLPKIIGTVSIVSNILPSLFAFFYKMLKPVGKFRRSVYLRHHRSSFFIKQGSSHATIS